MGQEYFINNQELQNKVANLLPSQGGAGAGFDLSASTQIIPIIDLTESAEGSNVRQDLQTALSFNSVTTIDVTNTTSTLISNTGYYRVFGVANLFSGAGAPQAEFVLSDGVSNKDVWGARNTGSAPSTTQFDFVVFLEAGDTLKLTCSVLARVLGSTRQIATIDGILVNP